VVALATVRVLRAEPAPAAAPMPRAANKAILYKLRNVAAADAAQALGTYLQNKKLSAVVAADPIRTTCTSPPRRGVQQQVQDMLAALDTAPPQVTIRVVVVQVPRGFVAQSGLNVGGTPGATTWTLSPRELHMLTALFRAAKERGECDVLSRPELCVCDGQTGYVQIGQDVAVASPAQAAPAGGQAAAVRQVVFAPTGLSLQMTPKVSADGKSVRLNTDVRLAEVTDVATAVPVVTTRSLRAAADLRFGQTQVFTGFSPDGDHSLTAAVRRLCRSEKFETLIIMTPHIIRSEYDHARILAEESAKMKWCLPEVAKSHTHGMEVIGPAGWFLK